MSYTFVNRPSVRNDIEIAVGYYKNINLEIAKQFLIRIKEAKAHIANTPFGFQIKYNQVRTLFLKQFPFHIHYFVDETNKQIVILAIIHAYKNSSDSTSK